MVGLLSYFKTQPKAIYIRSKPKVVEKIVYQKSFNAAKIDRLNEDFRIALSKINDDIRNSLTNLRGRSRTSASNNDYYIRYLNLWVSYVVGPQGFTLVSKGKDERGTPDKVGNDKVERAWRELSKKQNFSFNGRETFYSLQHRLGYTFARDGEIFIRIHKGAKNKFGISFSVIDPDFLDESYNVEKEGMKNGHRICQGIELDDAGRVFGYHFTDEKESQSNYGYTPKGGKKIFVPADQIIHWFHKVEVNQFRGFPPGQNLLLALHGLSELNESEMVSFRAASCKMGFKQQKFPDEETKAYNPNATDGSSLDEISAGLIEQLGPNEEFVGFNPDHKTGNWETFSRGIIRSASSGCGFPYPLLSNDYSGLNTDTINLMINDVRDYAKAQQKLMVDDCIDLLYDVSLPFMFLNNNANLPFGKLNKFMDRDFRGRAFQSLDILRDAQAMQILVNNGLGSRTKFNRDLNLDVEDTFTELGHEEEMAKEANFPLRNQGGTTEHNINSGATV